MELTDEDRQGFIDIGKQSLEQTARDNEEYMPRMLVEIDGELTVLGYPASFEGLRAVADFLIEQGHSVAGIILTVDTYHYLAPKGEDIGDANRYAGRLQELFESGNKMVSEALHITMITADELVSVSIPYRRHGHKINWREPIVLNTAHDGEDVQGRVPEVLREIIAETNAS